MAFRKVGWTPSVIDTQHSVEQYVFSSKLGISKFIFGTLQYSKLQAALSLPQVKQVGQFIEI